MTFSWTCYEALEGEGGLALAASLRRRYKAALIDEFQDTDPLQYAIFKKIYGYEKATLFLIGDPKQAIFGFRGADVFAYIRASGDVAQHFTLDRNWRSSEPIIRAVNAIFDRPDTPFLLERCSISRSWEAEPRRQELTFDGQPDPSPFKLWLLARRTDGKPLTRGSDTGGALRGCLLRDRKAPGIGRPWQGLDRRPARSSRATLPLSCVRTGKRRRFNPY